MLERPHLSLYVHIPWCIRKCPYCDFNSHQKTAQLPESNYLKALCEDIQFEARNLRETDTRKLHSIFIGGGTPSLFSASAIEAILNTARTELGFEDTIEITLEANPGAAEAQRFREYRAAGVNRLSLGIQSLEDKKLKALGRVHSSAEAKSAIEMCQQAGFENFNLDLMHGLPGQSVDQALSDLEQTINYTPSHISWYQLTIEPNTEFYSRPPELPSDAAVHHMQETGMQRLAEAGLRRYEVSAYGKPGHESLHNLNYWQFGDYLGVGAGAHGKLTIPQRNQIVRVRKRKQPDAYMAAQINRTAGQQEVSIDERPFEFLMNALRLEDGFAITDFEKRTGVTFSSIAKKVEYLTSQNLLRADRNRVTTTERGFRVLNSLLEEFL